MSKSISIIVPAYNEQEAIRKTLIRLKELYPEREIIVIDDKSTDQTYNRI